ncbi:hypothetical protein ABXT60_08765 [Candidatus Njordibacter sp. Uisw_056]|uniref:hypothetical protein n=1 Tax=Candidatus Njordibacter sp. Uisw_056 TaxID=3230973 RepID=UPI003D38C717
MYKKIVTAVLIFSMSGLVNAKDNDLAAQIDELIAEIEFSIEIDKKKQDDVIKLKKQKLIDLKNINIISITPIFRQRRSGLCSYDEEFGVHDGWCWNLEAVKKRIICLAG